VFAKRLKALRHRVYLNIQLSHTAEIVGFTEVPQKLGRQPILLLRLRL
jgi:hypothetical protein